MDKRVPYFCLCFDGMVRNFDENRGSEVRVGLLGLSGGERRFLKKVSPVCYSIDVQYNIQVQLPMPPAIVFDSCTSKY